MMTSDNSSRKARQGDADVTAAVERTRANEQRLQQQEDRIAKLLLVNQALWELVRERLNLTDADLERAIHEVDIRDEVEDGRISDRDIPCPACAHNTTTKRARCMYCGESLGKPDMPIFYTHCWPY